MVGDEGVVGLMVVGPLGVAGAGAEGVVGVVGVVCVVQAPRKGMAANSNTRHMMASNPIDFLPLIFTS